MGIIWDHVDGLKLSLFLEVAEYQTDDGPNGMMSVSGSKKDLVERMVMLVGDASRG